MMDGRRRIMADHGLPEPWTNLESEVAGRATGEPLPGATSFTVVTLGPEHAVVSATPGIYRVVGHRRLIGVPLMEALPELPEGSCRERLDRVLETGRSHEIGLERVPLLVDPGDPDARVGERSIYLAVHPVPDGGGGTGGLVITGVDLTGVIRTRRILEERLRRAEGDGGRGVLLLDLTDARSAREQLREARSLHETTVGSLREAVLVVDAGDRTILACNPAVTEITGYRRQELLGRSTEILHLDEESFRAFARRVDPALERDGVFRGEFRLRRRDGCVITTEHLVSVLETNGDADGPAAMVSVIRDLSEQKEREREIGASRRRLQELSRDLLRVREEERARISRHLHDVVGQTLTAAKFSLDAAEDEAEDSRVSERLERARELVADSLRQIRNLSVELRPAVLDDLGLLPAIRWYLDRLRGRAEFDIELSVSPRLAECRLPQELQTQAFRIFQEALLNVTRHADATRVRVALQTSGTELVLSVRDNGRGFEPERLRASPPGERQLGLVGMEERASLVRGTISVESSPGEGTAVRFRAPLGPGGGHEDRAADDAATAHPRPGRP